MTLFTLSGNRPGTYEYQFAVCACSMFMKNSTSFALTDSPFDHMKFFMLITACESLLVKVGVSASEREVLSPGLVLAGPPNM